MHPTPTRPWSRLLSKESHGNSQFPVLGHGRPRHPEGIAVSVQLPWYRSLWLSAVDDVAASVNGVAIPKESLRFELKGTSYSIAELPSNGKPCGSSPTSPRSIIPLDRVPDAGEKITSRSSSRCACCTCRSCRASMRPAVRHQPRAGRARGRAGMKTLRVAMIGYGFMGAAHSQGWRHGAAGVRPAGRAGDGGHRGPQR